MIKKFTNKNYNQFLENLHDFKNKRNNLIKQLHNYVVIKIGST